MTRSKEALERRAKKRNISIEEMKKLEFENNFNHKKLKLNENKEQKITSNIKTNNLIKQTKLNSSSSSSSSSSPPTSLLSSNQNSNSNNNNNNNNNEISNFQVKLNKGNERWKCSVCNNSNISKLSPISCNRCQRLRSEVDKDLQTENTNSNPHTNTKESEVGSEKIENQPNLLLPPPPPIITTTSTNTTTPSSSTTTIITTTTTPSNTKIKITQNTKTKKNEIKQQEKMKWDCEQASQQKINENMRLRTLYENIETRNQLSSEELERAKILVERSQRKKQKKVTRILNK